MCGRLLSLESPAGTRKNEAVDVSRYTPVVRHGGLSTGKGHWWSVQQLPRLQ